MKKPRLIKCARPTIIVARPDETARLRKLQETAIKALKSEGKYLAAIPVERLATEWTAKQEMDAKRKHKEFATVTPIHASRR
jgi:hypothetical protein